MKVLTVCQPYAGAIADGRKPVENRTWPTSYRGPLLIHAGKSRAWLSTWEEELDGPLPATMFFGAIVAKVQLVECCRIEDLASRHPELADHPHASGPWCWVLADVEALRRPVPCPGARGLWEIAWPTTQTLAEIVRPKQEQKGLFR
jgi:hypothetical protein